MKLCSLKTYNKFAPGKTSAFLGDLSPWPYVSRFRKALVSPRYLSKGSKLGGYTDVPSNMSRRGGFRIPFDDVLFSNVYRTYPSSYPFSGARKLSVCRDVSLEGSLSYTWSYERGTARRGNEGDFLEFVFLWFILSVRHQIPIMR